MATLDGGSLRFKIAKGPRLRFQMMADDTLLGAWQRDEVPPSLVALHRIGADAAKVRKAVAQPIPPAWEELSIPVSSTAGAGLHLKATFYRSCRSGRQPLVIFNHGSTGGGKWPARRVDRAWTVALVLRSLGLNVVVPMRRGRGESDGDSLEESSALTPRAQLGCALADLQATVDFMRARSDVDPHRIVLVGQSRGGFLSIAYAARHPGEIAGVINFAGGWYSNGTVHSAFDYDEMRTAGKSLRMPTLWLYADHDSYYALSDTERLFDTFTHAGGAGELAEVRDLKGDGHLLFAWPDAWEPAVRRYMAPLSAGRGL